MRRVTVAIYDTSGNLVQWRGGTANSVTGLRFGSSLPGGFGSAAFALSPAPRYWPVQVGYRLVISLGRRVAWWGWIEDMERRQRGPMDWLRVQALGPWQQINQRLMTADYDDVISSYVLRDMLIAYCMDISQDYSQIVNSGVPLTIDWEYKSLADLVKAVCDAGDDSDRPLLFAIWEPPDSRVGVANAGTLNSDPELEQDETYWEPVGSLLEYRTSPYVSTGHSWRWLENASTNLRTKDRIAATAGLSYVVEYQLYWTAYSGMEGSSRIDWYDSGNTLISTTYGATWTSNGTTTGWQKISDVHLAPAGTVDCVLHVGGTVGSGGGTARYFAVDDVRMYLYTANLAPETKPRAYLIARDLTDYDYDLRTANLVETLDVRETTKDLANYVVASYGSGSFTAAAQDADSQAAYRTRDALVAAGQVGATAAAAQRDAWLALHAEPGQEVGPLRCGDRSVIDREGRWVHPALLRAGDRLRVVDGRLAGTVFLIEAAEYDAESGIARVTPESYTDVSRMLARV